MVKFEAGKSYKFIAMGTASNNQLEDPPKLDIESLIPNEGDEYRLYHLNPDELPTKFKAKIQLTQEEIRWLKMLFYRNCIDAIYQRAMDNLKSDN